jgi:hypothetical protein
LQTVIERRSSSSRCGSNTQKFLAVLKLLAHFYRQCPQQNLQVLAV